MRQNPSNPYQFFTAHGERISILVKAVNSYPFVEGAGPPSFFAHPPNPTNDTRLFEFVESNPPNSDAVELVFSFHGANVSYMVTVSGSGGGGSFSVPSVVQVPGLSFQNLGLLFLAEAGI